MPSMRVSGERFASPTRRACPPTGAMSCQDPRRGRARCVFPGAARSSSAVLDERSREVTEYAMVKSADEMLCFDMNRQTTTLTPVRSSDVLDVTLPIVCEIHAASRRES